MKPFTTSNYPPLMFGEGISRQLGEKLREFGAKQILAVYDTGIEKAGIVGPILDSVKSAGITVVPFHEVLPDPPDYTIEAGRKAALAQNIDAVVGIGGGSALDTAKLIATYRECEPPVSRYYSDAPGHKPEAMAARKVKLILIPTTAGTGSEVTSVSVVTDTTSNQKRTIWGKGNFAADLALVDPCLTIGVPPAITASTGMDALAHSLETLTSKLRNPRAMALCGQSVEYIWRSLPKACENGRDMEARSELIVAAGMTLTAEGSRHLGHCIGHALGGKYHIPHGSACALALPAAMRYVAKDAPEAMALIADRMHLKLKEGVPVGEQVARALTALNRKLGIKTLKEMGIPWEGVRALVPEILADEKYMSKLDTRPTEQDVIDLLKEVYAS